MPVLTPRQRDIYEALEEEIVSSGGPDDLDKLIAELNISTNELHLILNICMPNSQNCLLTVAILEAPDASKVKTLVKYGAHPDGALNSYNPLAFTLFAMANCNAPDTKKEIAYYLIDHGASVYALDTDGSTVLMAACYSGDVDVVRLVLKKGGGCNLDVVDNDGYNALYRALASGNETIVEILKNLYIEQGKYPPPLLATTTYLIGAVEGRNIKNVTYALDELSGKTPEEIKKTINAFTQTTREKNENCTTYSALTCAAEQQQFHIKSSSENDANIVKLLLERGADPNLYDGFGVTPLYKASGGKRMLVSHLLLYGANPNLQNYDGQTPLMAAAVRCCVKIGKILLQNGADAHMVDDQQRGCLTILLTYRLMDRVTKTPISSCIEFTRALLSHGVPLSQANVCWTDYHGHSHTIYERAPDPIKACLNEWETAMKKVLDIDRPLSWKPESHVYLPPAFDEAITGLYLVAKRVTSNDGLSPRGVEAADGGPLPTACTQSLFDILTNADLVLEHLIPMIAKFYAPPQLDCGGWIRCA